MLCTRPNLSFCFCYHGQFSNNPSRAHWQAVKRVMWYLKGSLKMIIKYNNEEEKIIGYSNADWVGDVTKRKSTSGFIFILGGGVIN